MKKVKEIPETITYNKKDIFWNLDCLRGAIKRVYFLKDLPLDAKLEIICLLQETLTKFDEPKVNLAELTPPDHCHGYQILGDEGTRVELITSSCEFDEMIDILNMNSDHQFERDALGVFINLSMTKHNGCTPKIANDIRERYLNGWQPKEF